MTLSIKQDQESPAPSDYSTTVHKPSPAVQTNSHHFRLPCLQWAGEQGLACQLLSPPTLGKSTNPT